MYQTANPYPYYNPNPGYAYGVARPQARNTQPLTAEQIAKLRQNSDTFDMKVDQEDLWRAACTHKEKNGQSTLIANEDGTYTCTICQKTFNMCDSTKAEVEAAVKTLSDMLQTCKTVYLDIPEELARQYFQIDALLSKFPGLWERAMKNFSMYENTIGGTLNPIGPGYSGFGALQNLLTNPYAGFNYPQAQQPMAPNPYYPQAQQPIAGYGMPAAAPSYDNPMGYGVPTVAPAAAPAPGVMPGGAPGATPVATPTPTPVAAPAEVQQQQVFNV